MPLAQIVGVTPQPRMTPYLSIDMFKNHRRRGVQVDNLVPRGRPDEQDAALQEVIESASAEVDNIVLGILAATSDTELRRVNIDRFGYAAIHPRFRPIIALTAFSCGSTPNTMQALNDLTGSGVELNRFTVPTQPLMLTSSAGPLQFGNVSAPQDKAWCQYTYQNGYPITTLTAQAAQGATSIPVADTTGIVQGQTWITIYALQNRIRFLAGAVSTAPGSGQVGTGPGTVGCPALAAAVPNNPAYPTMVSALPADAIEAVVLITRAIIKETGGGAVVAPGTAKSENAKDPYGAGDDMVEAEEKLHPYLVPWE